MVLQGGDSSPKKHMTPILGPLQRSGGKSWPVCATIFIGTLIIYYFISTLCMNLLFQFRARQGQVKTRHEPWYVAHRNKQKEGEQEKNETW